MNKPAFLTLSAILLAPLAALAAVGPDFQSKHLAVGLSPTRPAFTWLAVDSLGKGKLDQNPALAYRACRQFADLARNLDHADESREFTDKADKLKATYVPTFLNPATGVLAVPDDVKAKP